MAWTLTHGVVARHEWPPDYEPLGASAFK